MRKIREATRFRRDYKREAKSQHGITLNADLTPILQALLSDKPLDKKYRDHSLSGDWGGHRECHVRPNLLLIYQKHGPDVLELVRLGSHAQLFE